MFLMYINDLGANIFSIILKFADDTKLVARVDRNQAVAATSPIVSCMVK